MTHTPHPMGCTDGADEFESLTPAVWRASTVVFQNLDEFVNRKSRLPDGFTYGTTGTPTQRALENRIAALDGANHCVVFPSGQAAICATLLTFLHSGDHLLMVDSAYGPARTFAIKHLVALGVEVEIYDPMAGERIQSLIKPNTKLIWMESPGSITMEIQDVESITRVAKKHGVLTGIDNTWASPTGFAALKKGVDICVHAATKFMGGHSDLLMGSASTTDAELYKKLRGTQAIMGLAVSAEDCYLVQRGIETMEVRKNRQAATALTIARYLKSISSVTQVMFPALESDPAHEMWVQHFDFAGSVLSFQTIPAPLLAYKKMFDEFSIFKIGASWGGTHSVVAYYPIENFSDRRFKRVTQPIIRLSVGLEDPDVLIDELARSLAVLKELAFVCSDQEEVNAVRTLGNQGVSLAK